MKISKCIYSYTIYAIFRSFVTYYKLKLIRKYHSMPGFEISILLIVNLKYLSNKFQYVNDLL